MPLIIRNKSDQLAFEFRSRSALRSVNELVDQLQNQLRAERAQHAFNVSALESQVFDLIKENAELRLGLARRDREAAFAAAPNLSETVH